MMNSSIPDNIVPTRRLRSISNEIATFSRMASASSSASDGEDHNSIISLQDDFYDEAELMEDDETSRMRRGLVDYCDIRGSGTGSTDGGSRGSLDEHYCAEDDDVEKSSLLVSHTNERQQAIDESDIVTINASRDQDDYLIRSPYCRHVMSRARTKPILASILLAILITCMYISDQPSYTNILRTYIRSKTHEFGSKMRTKQNTTFKPHPRPRESEVKKYPPFPAKELLGITVNTSAEVSTTNYPYDLSDFQFINEAGVSRTLTYWDDVVAAIKGIQMHRNEDGSLAHDDDSNATTSFFANDALILRNWGPCYPRALPKSDGKFRRGLLTKKDRMNKQAILSQNWTYIVQNYGIDSDNDKIHYPKYVHSFNKIREAYMGGYCKPGFLIIGQGKCGTSSLYHYITGHNRVLPAVQKQIHYFIFNTNKSLKWYYSNFPTIESFLGSGALMAGEASPGYMPYPSVIKLLVRRMSPTPQKSSTDRLNAYSDNIRSLPKIITVVRDPVERAVSSYKYNYIVPALNKMKRGIGVTASGEPIPSGRTEQFYNTFLYTFEELASAELATLKECLAPGGRGETYSYDRYGKSRTMFFYDTFQYRANTSMTPLINMDGACYEPTENKSVPRKQWVELANRNPDKILDLPNLQLTQSIVGRGLYVLPLEWWYAVATVGQRDDWIHAVCTEEMGDSPIQAMNDVTSFLGLPEFDFKNVTSVGRYNVGGHRGYDTVTAVEEEADESSEAAPKSSSSETNLTSISDELMAELKEFYRPYNERLFALIGKRCAWKE